MLLFHLSFFLSLFPLFSLSFPILSLHLLLSFLCLLPFISLLSLAIFLFFLVLYPLSSHSPHPRPCSHNVFSLPFSFLFIHSLSASLSFSFSMSISLSQYPSRSPESSYLYPHPISHSLLIALLSLPFFLPLTVSHSLPSPHSSPFSSFLPPSHCVTFASFYP